MATTDTAWSYLHSYDTSATGEVTTAAFNSNLAAMGWYTFNSTSDYAIMTKPVAKKQPNKWGVFDMHGNVWEWCQDWWWWYTSADVTDPQGPINGTSRVYRGGSWNDNAGNARSANRSLSLPDGRSSELGFRLVLLSGQ